MCNMRQHIVQPLFARTVACSTHVFVICSSKVPQMLHFFPVVVNELLLFYRTHINRIIAYMHGFHATMIKKSEMTIMIEKLV
jgi:hypothetical protein